MEFNEELEELIKTSMQIIYHAGNAQTLVTQALDKIALAQFDEANDLVSQSETEITQAHQVQTETIQAESRGERIEYLSLFAHAQDTLMTVKSEIKLVKKMLVVFENLNNRLEKLEEKI